MQTLIFRLLFLCSVLLCTLPCAAQSAQYKAVDSMTVLADKNLPVPVAELASVFARENLVSVSVVFGDTQGQRKQIEGGEAGDMLITSDHPFINQLKIKGLVDITSMHEVIELNNTHYFGVVIAGENMTPARKFLEFLQSDEARTIIASAHPLPAAAPQ